MLHAHLHTRRLAIVLVCAAPAALLAQIHERLRRRLAPAKTQVRMTIDEPARVERTLLSAAFDLAFDL